MTEKMPNKYNVQGISFESKDFLADAKKRADRLHLSLSGYICQLVHADLQKYGEPLVIRESSSPADSTGKVKPQSGGGYGKLRINSKPEPPKAPGGGAVENPTLQ